MDDDPSVDLPDFLRGAIAVIAQLPGAAILTDEVGQMIFANAACCGANCDGAILRPAAQRAFRDGLTVLDRRGAGAQALTLPTGRRIDVTCSTVQADGHSPGYRLVHELGAPQAGTDRGRQAPVVHDRDLAEEQRLKAEANHWRLLSMSDRLTGLFNATGFRDRVRTALSEDAVGAIVYADLNGFKSINDTLGHAAGDELLRDIGQAVQATIRTDDIAGRIGGDEFAIYLPGCPPEDLEKVVGRLRTAMTRKIPVTKRLGEPRQILTISPAIGTAIFPAEERQLDDLLRRADARMYADKAHQKAPRRLA